MCLTGRCRNDSVKFHPIYAMPSFFQNLFKKESDEPATATLAGDTPGTTEASGHPSDMNTPSPFAVSAGEDFTVRELTMLLPAQFVRSEALAGDTVVHLPLESLRASLEQGRPALG